MTAQPVLAPPLAGKPVVQHPRTDLARFPAWPRCPIACVPDAVPGLCVARPSANGQGTSTLRPRRARSHRSAHGVRAPRGDERGRAGIVHSRIPPDHPDWDRRSAGRHEHSSDDAVVSVEWDAQPHSDRPAGARPAESLRTHRRHGARWSLIGQLIAEPAATAADMLDRSQTTSISAAAACGNDGCGIPIQAAAQPDFGPSGVRRGSCSELEEENQNEQDHHGTMLPQLNPMAPAIAAVVPSLSTFTGQPVEFIL